MDFPDLEGNLFLVGWDWDCFLWGSVIYCALLGNAPKKSSSRREHEEGKSPQLVLWGSHVGLLLRPTCIDLRFF